jgi:parvulin-like peptidyl-prolyl isomerase
MENYIKRNMNLNHLFLGVILITFLPGWIADKKNDPVVAKIGDDQITLAEFNIAYMHLIKQPKVFDSKKLRENFLDELIQGRILSREAKRLNFDKNEFLEYKIEAYRNKCLREEHFQKVIKPQIHVDEKDVEEAYLFTQEERRISHLFFQNKSAADSVYLKLQNGASFDSLAKVVFKDTALASHGGELGWVNWDQLEYDMAMAAYSMKVDSFSAPIRSIYGYHILKVTGFKKKPMITHREYELHKRKAKYMLEFKIGDKLAFEYIDKMIKSAKIMIYPDVVHMLDEKLSEKFKRKPTQFDQTYELQLNDEEVKMLETNLWDERNKTIAIIDGKNLSVGDFIGYLSYVPYQVIYSGVKSMLDYIIRDYLITEEAKKMDLMKEKNVILKTRVYSENLLQLELRKKLVSEVNLNDSDLQNYYESHKEKYKSSSFEQVKDLIKETIKEERKREVIPDLINQLSKKIKISKDYNIIHRYYDAILKK